MKKLIIFLLLVRIGFCDTVYSHLKPTATDSLDIGTTSLIWRNIYADNLRANSATITVLTAGTASLTGLTGNWSWTGASTTNWSDNPKTIAINNSNSSSLVIEDSDGYDTIRIDENTNSIYFGNATENTSFSFLGTGTLSLGAITLSGNLNMGGNYIINVGELAFNHTNTSKFMESPAAAGNQLALASTTIGAPLRLQLFANDGDNTDSVFLDIFGLGTVSDITDSERLGIGWSVGNDQYEIAVVQAGTGVVKDLDIYTEGHTGQLLIKADGDNSMSGDLSFSATKGLSGNLAFKGSSTLDMSDADKIFDIGASTTALQIGPGGAPGYTLTLNTTNNIVTLGHQNTATGTLTLRNSGTDVSLVSTTGALSIGAATFTSGALTCTTIDTGTGARELDQDVISGASPTFDGTNFTGIPSAGVTDNVSASAVITDHTIVRGHGGAKVVQDSGIVIDDSDNVSSMGTLGCGAITSTGDSTFTGDIEVVGDLVVSGTDGTVTAKELIADETITLSASPSSEIRNLHQTTYAGDFTAFSGPVIAAFVSNLTFDADLSASSGSTANFYGLSGGSTFKSSITQTGVGTTVTNRGLNFAATIHPDCTIDATAAPVGKVFDLINTGMDVTSTFSATVSMDNRPHTYNIYGAKITTDGAPKLTTTADNITDYGLNYYGAYISVGPTAVDLTGANDLMTVRSYGIYNAEVKTGAIQAEGDVEIYGYYQEAIDDVTDENIGMYLGAVSGATTNYALYTNAGDVRLGGDTYWVGDGAGLAFGDIHGYDEADVIAIALAGIANKVQITTFDTDTAENNMDADHTNDHIIATIAGFYMCNVSASIKSSAKGGAAEFGLGVFKNDGDTLFENCHTHRQLAGGGGDIGSVSISGIIDLAASDTIEVWVWNEDGTDDIIIDDITLSLVQMGGT